MKISVEVELTADEIPQAAELLSVLRSIAHTVRPRRAKDLFKNLLSSFEDAVVTQSAKSRLAQYDATANEIRTVFSEFQTDDTTFDEFYDAFTEAIFSTTELVANEKSVVPYCSLLSRLPDSLKNRVRDKLVPHVIKFLTIKRPLDASRIDFFAHAEAFSALVKFDFVSISGAVTTIITLLKQPETRCAAITMLGKTVELCLEILKEKAEASKLSELRTALEMHVTEEVFRYDVSYIKANMGWASGMETAQGNLQLGGDSMVTTMLSAAVANPGLAFLPTGLAPLTSVGTEASDAAAAASMAPGPATPSAGMGAGAGASAGAGAGAGASASGGAGALGSVGEGSRSASPAGTMASQLSLVDSYAGHTGTIFAICYDALRNQIVSSGKDGAVIAWSQNGSPYERFHIPRHYVCSMDLNSRFRSLVLCGVPKDPSGDDAPAVFSYNLPEDLTQWCPVAVAEKSQVKLVSCVKAMTYDSSNTFVTGETWNDKRERVCFYDALSSVSSSLDPVVTYDEHEDIITCLSNFPSTDGLFFSGSRDWTIKLWDRRQQVSSATFGVPQSASKPVSKTTLAYGHDNMVTCLDVKDNILVSAGLDKVVYVWDLRMITSQPGGGVGPVLNKTNVDDSAVLKVAIGPTPDSAVVSTLRNLYFFDLYAGTGVPASSANSSHPIGLYHDLKWDSNYEVLYAAGETKSVDLYRLK